MLSEENLLAVSNYFTECSYGQFALEAVITPVLMMSKPATNYAGPNVFALFVEAHNAARAAGFPAEKCQEALSMRSCRWPSFCGTARASSSR